MTFTLWLYVTIHTTLYRHLILYKYITKELKLQKSNWFSLFKPNNGPLHSKRTYLVHFKTNLIDFCCFECAKCRTTKSFWGSKTIDQWPNILNFKLQIDFVNLNQTMIPFILEEHILFIFKKLDDFCHLECAKCKITKYFWGSKTIEQWPKILSFKL
jgi:hypothetical protein